MAKVDEKHATGLYGDVPSYGGPWGNVPGRVGADVDGKEAEIADMGAEAGSRDFNIADSGINKDTRDGALKYGKCVEAPHIN